MIYSLLIVVSLAQAQEVSTATPTVSIEDQIKIGNMGEAIRSLESGRYRQTGKPTFAGGICFADATCQTTADTGRYFRQFVSSMTTGMHIIAGTIPNDNTIPQISEGDQVLVATMTPVGATSRIKIEGVLNVNETVNSGGIAVVCLFRDSTADAIACFSGLTMEATSSAIEQIQFDFVVSAGDTSIRNYSVRIGNQSANSLTVNSGLSGAARFGGKLTSSLYLTEIAP